MKRVLMTSLLAGLAPSRATPAWTGWGEPPVDQGDGFSAERQAGRFARVLEAAVAG